MIRRRAFLTKAHAEGGTNNVRFESPDKLAVIMPENTVLDRGRVFKPRCLMHCKPAIVDLTTTAGVQM